MKLKSVLLKNVTRFPELKVDFYDEVKQKIRDRTVIVGKNGSGKTTLLEIIYSVINLLELGARGIQSVEADIFHYAVSELRLKIPPNDQEDFVIRTGNLSLLSDRGENLFIGKGRHIGSDYTGDSFIPRDDRANKVLSDIQSAVAGIDENPALGNLLYFPTDRMTHFKEDKGTLVSERLDFQWCYRYDRSHQEWKGSLESYLVWLYFRDLKLREQDPAHQSKFDQFKATVNRFLEGKEIVDVGFNYRVVVKDTITNREFGLEALSSGEKQVVLLIGEIYRRIIKGSIILIDEPEIHLHPVWQRVFVEALTQVCKDYNAQMILTTQSPKIAESVMQHEVISLDNLMEESGQ